jgi:hypothetical protein
MHRRARNPERQLLSARDVVRTRPGGQCLTTGWASERLGCCRRHDANPPLGTAEEAPFVVPFACQFAAQPTSFEVCRFPASTGRKRRKSQIESVTSTEMRFLTGPGGGFRHGHDDGDSHAKPRRT